MATYHGITKIACPACGWSTQDDLTMEIVNDQGDGRCQQCGANRLRFWNAGGVVDVISDIPGGDSLHVPVPTCRQCGEPIEPRQQRSGLCFTCAYAAAMADAHSRHAPLLMVVKAALEAATRVSWSADVWQTGGMTMNPVWWWTDDPANAEGVTHYFLGLVEGDGLDGYAGGWQGSVGWYEDEAPDPETGEVWSDVASFYRPEVTIEDWVEAIVAWARGERKAA